jgi:hypothetical protein
MSWGAVIGAGAGLLGSAMSSSGDKNGGAGTQSQSKEPWAPAQPWLLSNIVQGQNLQNQYTANPFSPKQQAAYDNSYAQGDYMRSLIPGLLGQMQDQPMGFDPANPLARPKAWDWNALGGGGNGLGQRSLSDAAARATPAKEEPKLADFLQQGDVLSGATMSSFDGQTMLGNGGYGSFRYGMDVKPGTKEYRDMSEYFAMGGMDPNNQYGRGDQYKNPKAHPLSYMWTSGLMGGAPGESEGPSSGAPGGAASAGPGGTF